MGYATEPGKCACCGLAYPRGSEVELDTYLRGYVLTIHPTPPSVRSYRRRRYRRRPTPPFPTPPPPTEGAPQ